MGRDREILEIVARYCGKTSSIYRYIAQDIAALTREAAPQANPHAQELMPQELSGEAERIAANLHKTGHGLAATVMRELIRRLATTDSAIQSQQGATGGAVDDAMVERAYRAWQAAVVDEHHVGNRESLRIALIAALAHPQAAGSAPGEALHPAHTVEAAKRAFNIDPAGSVASGAGDAELRSLLWDMKQAACRAHRLCYEAMLTHPEIATLGDDGELHAAIHAILAVDTPMATPATAAGSAPVGVDGLAMLERAREQITHQPHGDNCYLDPDHVYGQRCECGKEGMLEALDDFLAATPAIDAALEKERAE